MNKRLILLRKVALMFEAYREGIVDAIIDAEPVAEVRQQVFDLMDEVANEVE